MAEYNHIACPVCGNRFKQKRRGLRVQLCCSPSCSGVLRDGRVVERFGLRFVAGSADECWPWKGSFGSGGYGAFCYLKRSVRAHRVAWEIANGQIPKGLNVLHRCDNPPCVNPGHLFLGTTADNVADRVQKGRTCAGERSNFAKLDAYRVLSILSSKGTRAEIARNYGVSWKLVDLILKRKVWKHLPVEGNVHGPRRKAA